jgi:3-dehydroquinate dehydratase-2
VVAPETAAHAAGTAALLPMLALGIPGSPTAAVLLVLLSLQAKASDHHEPALPSAAGDTPVVFRQTNSETQMIDWIHEAIDTGAAGIVINPAAYTFTSIAILDALKMFPTPIVELHISNIHRREQIYHRSLVSGIATAVIAGLGPEGYGIAVSSLKMLIAKA